MQIKFNKSLNPTVGIELEVQTIHPRTGELVAGAKPILADLSGQVHYKPELFTSTLEINTPVCDSIGEIEKEFIRELNIVRETAHNNNLDILISGCHPFANWQQQQITPEQRYLNLLNRIQWPVRQFLIFGLHVHVGIDDAEKAVYVMNRLSCFIPQLIALSSSSPYWNGFDTGLASTRIKIFEELPNAGIPYYIESWQDYSNLVSNLVKTKSIDTVRDIWWDIRPHPIFGTIEVRICDAMPTVKENMALTALIFLLVKKFSAEFAAKKRHKHCERWILAENKWRAARFGTQGQIITKNGKDTISIKEDITNTVQELRDDIKHTELEYIEEYLNTIDEILTVGPSYLRQRQWLAQKPGDYKFIIDNLLLEGNTNQLISS